MAALSWFRIGGSLAALVALAALAWLARDRFDQKAVADAARACEKAAGSESDALADCLPGLRAAIEAQRRAALCEASLGNPLPAQSRFAVRMACGEQVKRMAAERDALRIEADQARAAMQKLIDGQAAAIARAEARADQAQAKARKNEQTIQNAPRDPDGLVRCDAQCLRDLAS
ncbi:MAG: hypothetical protein R3E02_09995 [Blastomonas sp.]